MVMSLMIHVTDALGSSAAGGAGHGPKLSFSIPNSMIWISAAGHGIVKFSILPGVEYGSYAYFSLMSFGLMPYIDLNRLKWANTTSEQNLNVCELSSD